MVVRLGKSIGMRLPALGNRLKIGFENLAARRGVPLDQTTREALAQIQVVARKLPP